MAVPIYCPVCGRRLMDADDGAVLKQTHVEAASRKRHSDYWLKCPKCKSVIGVTKNNYKSIA